MRKTFLSFLVSTFAVLAFSLSSPVFADRDGGHRQGNQKHQNHPKHQKNWNGGQGRHQQNDHGQNYRGGDRQFTRHFDVRQRGLIHDYYSPRFQSGRCPPGLAKKHNGCLPPGQAKKWRIGSPLPRDVIFYDLPPHLAGQLGYPGPGYRYVRVAADILLITVGTGMVLDAIADLNSM